MANSFEISKAQLKDAAGFIRKHGMAQVDAKPGVVFSLPNDPPKDEPVTIEWGELVKLLAMYGAAITASTAS